MKITKGLSFCYFIAVALTIFIFFSACKKSNDAPVLPIAPAPVIASISPNHAPYNTTVTISGTNFNTTPSSNIVTINGVAASVLTATATQLTVLVPIGAGSGAVIITANGASSSGVNFNYDYTAIVSTLNKPGALGLGYIIGIAIDSHDNVFVTDYNNNQVKKVDTAGLVSVLAGAGSLGYLDGPGSVAKFDGLWSIAVDNTDNLYVTDLRNQRVRKITQTGVVSTVAGNGVPGYVDGPAATAQFNYPSGIDVDNAGNIFVVDRDNYAIRKITGTMVSTFKGGSVPNSGQVYGPGIQMDNGGSSYLANAYANVVTQNIAGGGWATFGSEFSPGHLDGIGHNAQFYAPADLAMDAQGNFYLTDIKNAAGCYIRKITLSTGAISTIAGDGVEGTTDGVGTVARFSNANGITISKSGKLYVADSRNGLVRKIVFQ